MKRNLLLSVFLFALVACGERHFISDAAYRGTVEADFQRKKALFGEDARELYSTFECPMTTEEREALTFLFAYSPLCDITYWGGDFLLRNVCLSLQAREEMPWGRNIPEDIFRHFVLPVRGKSEALDSSRQVFYEALKERVSRCASMEEAALEVNHWCHEHVVYKPTNARTASPLSTMCAARGRCGEESIFTLAALRSVSIPARQIYVPRWSHCDDNHAWIEVWVDGEWKYLGACEPEPRLNLAWFTDPVQQAMYVVADVFGKYPGKEDIVGMDADNTTVNVTSRYTPTTRTVVRVVDSLGMPVEGAKVDYRVFNYGEYYPVVTLYTDAAGETALSLGKGCISVWGWKGDRFGVATFDVAERDTLTLELRYAVDQQGWRMETVLQPPVARSLATTVTAEERARNDRRFAREDSIREAYIATFPSLEVVRRQADSLGVEPGLWQRLVEAARGNHAELWRFMSGIPGEWRGVALDLLTVVPEKDLQDTPADVWMAHLGTALPYRDEPLFKEYILNPRVGDELLTAYREPLGLYLEEMGVTSVPELVEHVRQFRGVDTLFRFRGIIPPEGIICSGVTDRLSRSIFFVAACRSMGIPARLNPMTGQPEYAEYDRWLPITLQGNDEVAKGTLMLTCAGEPVGDPTYFLHFTIGKVEPGTIRTINLGRDASVDMGAGASFGEIFSRPVELEEGHYILATGNRDASGAVHSRLVPFEIVAGRLTTLPLEIPAVPEGRTVLGQVTLPPALEGLGEDEYALLAVLEANTEPTNHFLRDMGAAKADFEALPARLCFFFKDAANREKFRPEDFRPFPANLAWDSDTDGELLSRLAGELDVTGTVNLPLVLVVNGKGEVTFLSRGYRVGLGAQVLKQLK